VICEKLRLSSSRLPERYALKTASNGMVSGYDGLGFFLNAAATSWRLTLDRIGKPLLHKVLNTESKRIGLVGVDIADVIGVTRRPFVVIVKIFNAAKVREHVMEVFFVGDFPAFSSLCGLFEAEDCVSHEMREMIETCVVKMGIRRLLIDRRILCSQLDEPNKL
jgi:rRNA processing protein Gar1